MMPLYPLQVDHTMKNYAFLPSFHCFPLIIHALLSPNSFLFSPSQPILGALFLSFALIL